MVTKSLQLGLQDFTRIMNNCAYSGRLLKWSSSSSTPSGSKFSISLASILNGENMQFRPQFLIGSYLLRFGPNGTKNLSFNS